AAVDKGVGLLGIVRQQPDLRQPKVFEQLDSDAVVARVGLEAEREVRFDRVETVVLQLIGLDLFDQPDAAAFLWQIDEYAGPFAADHVEGHVKLVAAIATERIEQISGEA